jgi:hypothetical protein
MEEPMKIYSLKRITIPKLAVLVAGLATAFVVATVAPLPAQANPGRAANCAGCHSAGGSIAATPSTATPAANANYTVQLSPAPDGYWITGTGVSLAGGSASSVTVKAPAAAGTYTYTVYVRNGNAAQTTYRITVAPVTPPTTIPPTTPPTTIPPTTPPATSTATINRLSPNDGELGDRVTITGRGFGKAGVVKFSSISATVSSWSDTRIVVRVPRGNRSSRVLVTVTPANGTASNAVTFRIDSHDDDGDDD